VLVWAGCVGCSAAPVKCGRTFGTAGRPQTAAALGSRPAGALGCLHCPCSVAFIGCRCLRSLAEAVISWRQRRRSQLARGGVQPSSACLSWTQASICV
jgi:hypothetical protein